MITEQRRKDRRDGLTHQVYGIKRDSWEAFCDPAGMERSLIGGPSDTGPTCFLCMQYSAWWGGGIRYWED